jgi:hypothetical protein
MQGDFDDIPNRSEIIRPMRFIAGNSGKCPDLAYGAENSRC